MIVVLSYNKQIRKKNHHKATFLCTTKLPKQKSPKSLLQRYGALFFDKVRVKETKV